MFLSDKYLFSLSSIRFLFLCIFLLNFPLFSPAKTLFYDNQYPAGDYIICNKDEIELLYILRTYELENDGYTGKGSLRYYCNSKLFKTVIFKEIMEEYSFPFMKVFYISDNEGKEACPGSLDKNCKKHSGIPKKYVFSYALSDVGNWYKVYIEIDGSIELLEDPSDAFYTALVKEFSRSLNNANEESLNRGTTVKGRN